MDRRRFLASSVAAVAAASAASALPRRVLAGTAPIDADIQAVTASGGKTAVSRSELQALRDSLRGALMLPGEPGYDVSRKVQNGSIDKHPALIVQPSGPADVRTAVLFAKQHDLLLAVKCGGHSYSGKSTCDGGMQIDLARIRGVSVDPARRVAYVAGGSLLGDLDHEAMALGLVTTAGTVSHTGVGGLTLGGGFGRLARRFGLALDNVRSMQVVTADGRFLRAAPDENADLYWALRGGGGNFGVVTQFEFGLHPMDRQVIGGKLVFPIARAKELMAAYSEFSLAAPDELYCDAGMVAPPGGAPGVFLFDVCYSGPAKDAERVLAPLRKLGTPLKDGIAAVDYTKLQKSGDTTDLRIEGEYMKTGFMNAYPAALVDTQLQGFQSAPDRTTMIFFQHAGGAIDRVATDATAFPHRRARLNMLTAVSWDASAGAADRTGAEHVKYLRSYWASLEKFTDGYYTNEVSNEPQKQLDDNYQGNLARLRTIKKKYDPTNLFRLNANVLPA